MDENSTEVCAYCKRATAHRVDCKGLIEKLLRLGYVYPFSCRACGQRYLEMKWGIRYVRSQVNRRQHTRIIAKLEARFDCERGGAEAEVFDLSLGGCGLPTDFQLHPGDLLRLDLRSDGWQLQELNGVVRWTAFSFAGVEFKALDTDDRKTLRSLVELHFHDDTPICDGASNSPSS